MAYVQYQTSLRRVFSRHTLLLACSALYVLAACAILSTNDAANFDDSNLWLIWVNYSGPLLVGLILGVCLKVVIIEHPAHPIGALWRDVRTVAKPNQLLESALLLFIFAPVAAYCMRLKSLIPYLNPVKYDQYLVTLDHIIGFGQLPQTRLDWLLQSPWSYKIVSLFYSAGWAIGSLSVLAYTIFVAAPGFRKTRFMLAYFLVWMVLGSGLAIALNSGGPLFFHTYTGLDNYDAFTAKLASLSGQTEWTSYALSQSMIHYFQSNRPAPVALGISAMPSLHIATAVTVVLHTHSRGLLARWIGILWLGLLYLGSIVTGWHYAIDGIVAVGFALLIWQISNGLTLAQGRLLLKAYGESATGPQ